MKLSSSKAKKVLFELFFELHTNPLNGSTALMQKEFVLEKLFDAASAKKKISACMKQVDTDKVDIDETEIEFVPAEIVVLKQLFDAKKNFPVDDADGVMILKELFNPTIPKEA